MNSEVLKAHQEVGVAFVAFTAGTAAFICGTTGRWAEVRLRKLPPAVRVCALTGGFGGILAANRFAVRALARLRPQPQGSAPAANPTTAHPSNAEQWFDGEPVERFAAEQFPAPWTNAGGYPVDLTAGIRKRNARINEAVQAENAPQQTVSDDATPPLPSLHGTGGRELGGFSIPRAPWERATPNGE